MSPQDQAREFAECTTDLLKCDADLLPPDREAVIARIVREVQPLYEEIERLKRQLVWW